jgi:glycosyltransferase involved in cell wall biosynthesis
MKIGIDARFLTHPQPGGFKTYVENLIASLAQVDSGNEYVLYLDRLPNYGSKLPAGSNFTSRVVPGSWPVIGMPWREQVALRNEAAKDRIDLFHAPCLTAPLYLNCPLVITVHDMIWAWPQRISRKGSLSIKRQLMGWYNYAIPKSAMKRASAIITVSHAARESIIARSGIKADRIFVTYEAASPSFKQINDEQRLAAIRRKYELPVNFILAIGSADPRKNIDTLVQAYSCLPGELQEQHQLVIVWTHSLLADALSQKIEELGLVRRVRFLRQVSTDDLVLLYNAASLFVFPSLYEGFGLPPLEAMACGTPVIAANNSSIPEIVGDAALLFDATIPDAIARTMLQALAAGEAFRTNLIQNELKRADSFSWQRCATQTLGVYQRILSTDLQKS